MQVTDVVSGAVLGKAIQPGDDPAVDQYRLDARDLLAHASVPKHPDPAGVGGDHATDGGRVARGQVDAEVQAGRPRVRGQCGQCHPGTRL